MFKKMMVVTAMLFLSGCALFRWKEAEIYPMSYDQTYLMAAQSLDELEDWKLVETDQTRGIIKIENSGYLKPTREMTVIVKRIEPFRTKVELYGRPATPFTQKFFRAIDRRVAERAVTYPT